MSVILIVHFQVKNDKENEVENFSRQLAEVSLKEIGCLSFKITRARGNKNTFLLFEEYTNIEAAVEHQRSIHYQSLIVEQILPCLIDRRIYVYEGLV
jgi:autoinducer 2-degrading protein